MNEFTDEELAWFSNSKLEVIEVLVVVEEKMIESEEEDNGTINV